MNSSIFTKNNKYLMLALDQRGSFRKMLNPEDPDTTGASLASRIKGEILAAVYDQFSGTLIDFDYGLPAYKLLPEFTKPFLLPVEESGYTDQAGERVTKLLHTAEEVKAPGAAGVKLLVYYNPGAITAQAQIETARKALEDAHTQELPFFLEIVNYGIEPQVAQSVQDFLDATVVADVFKLEYPGSLEECQKVSSSLGDTPWIILTKGVDFNDFTPKLETAIAGGASGFLAGRALWKEYLQLTEPVEKERFLNETLPSRFAKVAHIALAG